MVNLDATPVLNKMPVKHDSPIQIRLVDVVKNVHLLPDYVPGCEGIMRLKAGLESPLMIPAKEKRTIETGIAINISDESIIAEIVTCNAFYHATGVRLVCSPTFITSKDKHEVRVVVENTSNSTISIIPGQVIALVMLRQLIPFSYNIVDNFV